MSKAIAIALAIATISVLILAISLHGQPVTVQPQEQEQPAGQEQPGPAVAEAVDQAREQTKPAVEQPRLAVAEQPRRAQDSAQSQVTASEVHDNADRAAILEALFNVDIGMSMQSAKNSFPAYECSSTGKQEVCAPEFIVGRGNWLGTVKEFLFTGSDSVSSVTATYPNDSARLDAALAHLSALYGPARGVKTLYGGMTMEEWRWTGPTIVCGIQKYTGINISGESKDEFALICADPHLIK